jgi:hypothetical protein
MLRYGALSSHRQTDPQKLVMPVFSPKLIYSTATARRWWLTRWVDTQPLPLQSWNILGATRGYRSGGIVWLSAA